MPIPVREALERLLGAPVGRAMRAWGGYTPTPTFRLGLRDGRRVFVKGAHPRLIEGARRAIVRERRAYEELRELMGRWAPAYHGALEQDGWTLLVLADLGPRSAPPWNRRLAGEVLRDYAAFHDSTRSRKIPSWLRGPGEWALGEGRSWDWAWKSEDLGRLIALAGPQQSAARTWIEGARRALADAAQTPIEADAPRCLLHLDTRSDNLRWVSGHLYLLDWPHAAVGPAEEDVAAFVQSITVEGGPEPEELLGMYDGQRGLDPVALDRAIAGWAGFFAHQGAQQEIPELPRLRSFQRQQLRVTLQWAARRLGLSPPAWVEAMAGSR